MPFMRASGGFGSPAIVAHLCNTTWNFKEVRP